MKMTSVAVVKENNMNGTFALIKKTPFGSSIKPGDIQCFSKYFMSTDFQYRNIQKKPKRNQLKNEKCIQSVDTMVHCRRNGSDFPQTQENGPFVQN